MISDKEVAQKEAEVAEAVADLLLGVFNGDDHGWDPDLTWPADSEITALSNEMIIYYQGEPYRMVVSHINQ